MSPAPAAPPVPEADRTLADVLPAAASLLGVGDGVAEVIPSGPLLGVEAVTVLLIDGLGWNPWQELADLTPAMTSLAAATVNSTVPSTTPTALASLGTGLRPGGHGIVGAAFWVPEDELMLHPLSWGGDPHPQAVQPEPTVFERVASAGVPVQRIGAGAYAHSGLTRAVLRGGEYVAAETHGDMVDTIARHQRGLGYAYLPDLDRIGHVHGTDSDEWRACLVTIDRLVEQILGRISPQHLLVVTADHGMVDCSDSGRIAMESLPSLADVVSIGGEPRLRHVYVTPGAAPRIAREWTDALGESAWVFTREEFLARGLMGIVDPAYAERVGDLVAVAAGDTVLTSSVDPLVSGLIGQHGSLTEVEMRIPLLSGLGHGHG